MLLSNILLRSKENSTKFLCKLHYQFIDAIDVNPIITKCIANSLSNCIKRVLLKVRNSFTFYHSSKLSHKFIRLNSNWFSFYFIFFDCQIKQPNLIQENKAIIVEINTIVVEYTLWIVFIELIYYLARKLYIS